MPPLIARDHEALWPPLSLQVDPIPEAWSVLSHPPDPAVHPHCFRALRERGMKQQVSGDGHLTELLGRQEGQSVPLFGAFERTGM